MQRVGPGRTPAESVFEVAPVASPADEIEFVFNDGSGHYDNAPAPPQNTPQGAAPAIPVPYQSLAPPYNYRTSLDVFTVQDGQVFNYQPAATVSAPTITTRFVNSTVNGIPGRNIHIFLPRGYVENTSRRYPVVYFHDGQNVFFPGGTFGTWDADRIATYETSQGRMREAILVAIDNGNDYGSDRMVEYIPPGDQLSGQPPGTADKYVQFLRDNVLPTLDYNYRTLNQPGQPTQAAANLTVGSSLGGLLTAYMGMTNSNVFGKIGVFLARLLGRAKFHHQHAQPRAEAAAHDLHGYRQQRELGLARQLGYLLARRIQRLQSVVERRLRGQFRAADVSEMRRGA